MYILVSCDIFSNEFDIHSRFCTSSVKVKVFQDFMTLSNLSKQTDVEFWFSVGLLERLYKQCDKSM